MISENTLYEKHCRRLSKSAVHPLECILNNEYTVNSVAFPKGHTPEEFLDGNKKAIRRNKLITGVLYYSDDMETFATGLKRIKDLCDEAGCKVEFRMEQDDFVVVFYRNLREEWNSVVKAQNLDGTNQDTNQDTVQDKIHREEKILGFCVEPRTRAEIQEYIGISNRGYFRTEILEPLLSGGKLLRTIPDKPNSRNQKYVTAVKTKL